MNRVWEHMSWLASEPRPAETDRLEECRRYCIQHLNDCGWDVRRDPFTSHNSIGFSLNGVNLVGHRRVPESSSARNDRPVFVLGAHLDSCPGTPGADDNASAVAALLDVAAAITEEFPVESWNQCPVELELVIFDLEENGMLGAAFHADGCRQQQRNVLGMVSLEMLGYCSRQPGSQSMPPELQGIYSDVGNFIGVVGNQNSTALIQHFADAFASIPDLPRESLQVPDNGRPLPPTRLSDHSPFWDAGYPALMITDTSFLRNPHYHEPTDTPETLDPVFLTKVTAGVIVAVRKLLQSGLRSG
ncbi:MAG: M28 family peptidase [Planctomycetaceae bacterium]